MAEISLQTINVDSLRDEIREPVRFFAQRLQEDVGENLQSFTVIGSSLTADFNPKRSDINTILVIEHRSHKLLKLLAGLGEAMGRKRLRAPLLMTREYIERSLDVFGIEFLDFQHNHQTVFGADPFADLVFQKQWVRLQCERELKSALIQLRQGYIRALGKHNYVGSLLVDCVKKLIVLMRTMLWLTDIDRPREVGPTVDQAAERFAVPIKGRDAALALYEKGGLPAADLMDPMFEDVYQMVDHLGKLVDQMKV
jgi:hypothetical protein